MRNGNSMELALHGSQINLATRNKATTARAVNYPIYFKRPGSASVTLTTPSAQPAGNQKLSRAHSLQCLQLSKREFHPSKQQHLHQNPVLSTKASFKRRAASADIGKRQSKTSNPIIGNRSFSPHSIAQKSICSNQKNKRSLASLASSSSSNICKFLLAEPIKRNTWMTSEQETLNTSAKTGENHEIPVETTSNIQKNSNDDLSVDSPSSSIAEEYDDDFVDNYYDDGESTDVINPISKLDTECHGIMDSECEPLTNEISKRDNSNSSKYKMCSNSLLDTKMEQKQTKTTVIKPKTLSSLVTTNSNHTSTDKFKLTKSSIKQVSIVHNSYSNSNSNNNNNPNRINNSNDTGANENKKQQHPMDSTHPSSSTLGSSSVPIEKCVKINESKSNEAPTPKSSTATAAISTGFNTLKTDLPGRVSFSKNDVYEIDYSDIDNDTDTSRSFDLNETFRKKNVHFEDENFNKSENGMKSIGGSGSVNDNIDNMFISITTHNGINDCDAETGPKSYATFKKSSGTLRCKTELPALPEDSENGSTTYSTHDSPETIIEEYKREIENINRQHELERFKWSAGGCKQADLTDYESVNRETMIESTANENNNNNNKSISNKQKLLSNEMNEWHSGSADSWTSSTHRMPTTTTNPKIKSMTTLSNTSDDSPTRDSTSTVINNYLKITNQSTNPSKPSSATIKLKTTKKLTPTAPSTVSATGTKSRKIKSAQVGRHDLASSKGTANGNGITKAKSVGQLQRLTDIKLNEFHIDKVESWMSTHEDAFSDVGLNSYRKTGKFGSSSNLEYKKAWRETPTKTDDEGNYSLDDQIDVTSMDGSGCGEIELVLNKMEGRRMKISFDSIKNASSVPTLSIEGNTTPQSSSKPLASGKINSANSSTKQSSNKIKEIYQYLDEVDFNCDRTIHNMKWQKVPDTFTADINLDYLIDAQDVVGDVPKLSDIILLSNDQLARKVVNLSLRANELTHAIQLSKEHVEKIRMDNQKLIRTEKQMSQNRMREQKSHYEAVVARHQEFIEQLLKDKASLCEKVSALTRRLESQQQVHEHKLQTEIQSVKETALAGEKIRRERWVRENTKKIKELTVKGLEQEISKITCNHQKEITELKRQHQQQILDAVDEARHKHESSEMNMRQNYAQDREVAIEKERNAIRERFERQMEKEQKSFEEQKNKLLTEFAMEKDRLLNEQQQKEYDLGVQRDKCIKEKKELVEHLNRECNDKIRMIEKRNQAEIASIRDQFESDFAIWKREHETAYKLREVENANNIRQQCRIERDKQIDSIVAKVDAESLKIQVDFEAKISRLKSQHEHDLREMEAIVRQTREKCTQTRSKLAEYEANIQNLHATVKQLEIQLNHSQKMCENFSAEKEHFKENAKRDTQDEVDALRQKRDDEIQQIHKRVQCAIAKKDESLIVIQKENATLKDRCIKLEAIVRQQRKDYCTK